MNLKSPWSVKWSYHIARYVSSVRKRAFMKQLDGGMLFAGTSEYRVISLPLITMAGKDSFDDLALSIYSFVKSTQCKPEEWVVVSDGTLGREHEGILKGICNTIRLFSLSEVISNDIPDVIKDLTTESWLYRKLAILMSYGCDRPALFVDSDVLFLNMAGGLVETLLSYGSAPAYLEDCGTYQNYNLLPAEYKEKPSVNSGIVYLTPNLDWSEAVAAIARVPRHLSYDWLDQTATHIAMHSSNASALLPDRFIMDVEDQFSWRDVADDQPEAICRHYVGPIRHKMWLKCLSY